MKLFYQTYGAEANTAVVLLHGFLENHKMWFSFAQELKENYFVIVPDLLGHGESPVVSDSHTMKKQAQAVANVLEEQKVEKAVFIGHSMGGYIALALAKYFPERVNGLGLFFSSSLADSPEKSTQRLEAVKLVERDRESFIRHSIPLLFDANSQENLTAEIAQAKDWALETPADGIKAALLGMREREDATYILEEASYPVAILLGENDNAIDLQLFQSYIPKHDNIHVSTLPVGHMGHLEAPAESLVFIQQLLQRIT